MSGKYVQKDSRHHKTFHKHKYDINCRFQLVFVLSVLLVSVQVMRTLYYSDERDGTLHLLVPMATMRHPVTHSDWSSNGMVVMR